MSWAEEQDWFGLEDLCNEDTDWNSEWMDPPTETLWECKDGTIIAIEDMKTNHIKNCIAMIYRSLKANKPWRTEYLEPLTEELKRRIQNAKKVQSL